jgi:hypothetical protein
MTAGLMVAVVLCHDTLNDALKPTERKLHFYDWPVLGCGVPCKVCKIEVNAVLAENGAVLAVEDLSTFLSVRLDKPE